MLVAWLNNPEIRPFLRVGRFPLNGLSEVEYIRKLSSSKTDIVLMVVERSSGRPIGVTGLHAIDTIDRRATFGIMIASPEHRGRGMGTEVLRALARHAFRWLNLHKLELEVYASNARAIACYAKVGFIEEGRLRERTYIDGKYEDVVLMGLLDRELTPN